MRMKSWIIGILMASLLWILIVNGILYGIKSIDNGFRLNKFDQEQTFVMKHGDPVVVYSENNVWAGYRWNDETYIVGLLD